MRIAFLVPYPYDIAPGQRFRYEQYLQSLKNNGFEYELFSFLDEETNRILYKKGKIFKKVTGVLKGFVRRLIHLWKSRNADFIFVYREATPFGFPIIEWILVKIFKRKLIYDFDDAIWIPTTSNQNKLISFLKYPKKVPTICDLAYKISVGNDYLGRHATEFAQNSAKVVLNPTTIDTIQMHNILHEHQEDNTPIIGWTGSHSTLVYLNELVPVLQELEKQYSFRFRVICNHNPELELKSFEFVAWNKTTEIQDLAQLSIGVMPLTTDAWSEGKCGFKALQYMALGVPAIVSPIGVNKNIVTPNYDGFWADSPQEWKSALESLLQSPELRKKLGQQARETVVKNYSVQSNTTNFLTLFS